jgi:hypothetical protein
MLNIPIRRSGIPLLLALFLGCGRSTLSIWPPISDSGTGGKPNLMGINLSGTSDWMAERLYADVVRMSREFMEANTNGNGPNRVPVDADGWPTTDFSFAVWAGIDQMSGTYALSFIGQASVSGPDLGTLALSYDPATNTSSATAGYITTSSSFFWLNFTGTKRTPSSAAGSGVTAIKLMRPTSPGSTETHPVSELFNRAAKAELSKFKVVRFKDFNATDFSVQVNWRDRPLPSWASFNRNPGGRYGWQGIGGPWEHVIRLSNELRTDAWIDIPFNATDDYVRNVAQVFAYGSDGVNPYPGARADPAYPPLDSNLNLYIEYSNELWNSLYTQTHDNCRATSEELVGNRNSPLNFDNTWNGVAWIVGDPLYNPNFDYEKCWRRIAKRGAEISNIFRSVFGDAAMGARIRPVLMTQQNDGQGTFTAAMKMMFGYYDNGEGNFVSNPHPPSYYFYGAGGSGYYSPPDTVASVAALFSSPEMTPAGWAPSLRTDAAIAVALGLKRVCYEGGPGLDTIYGPRDAISAQAVDDPRMTSTIVSMHKAWSSFGGGLLVYFQAAGDYQWGFTPNIYNLGTAKLKGIDRLNATAAAPINYGTRIPGSVAGNMASVCSISGCPPIPGGLDFTAARGRDNLNWASYSFLSNDSLSRNIVVSVSRASNAQVTVYLDGVSIGTLNGDQGSLVFNAGMVDPGLHGVIVRAVAGTFGVDQVAFQ